jgi:hypothetical protein
MNAASPSRGSRKTFGRRRNQTSLDPGLDALRELDRRLELRERLCAVADELAQADADVDVPATLLDGVIEDLDEELRP